MRKLFIAACAISASLTNLNSETGELAFLWKEAASYYRDGNYLQAAQLYEKAADMYPGLWQSYYNAGNADYKAGLFPQALERYWQAYHLNPRKKGIIENLDLTVQKTGDVFAPPGVPVTFFKAWNFLKKEEWTALALILWLLLSIGFLIKNLRTGWILKNLVPRSATECICLLLMILSLIPAISRTLADKASWGVLKGPGLLRSGPSENLPITMQIPEGRRVLIVEVKKDWVLIETRKEKIRGWLKM